MKPWTHPIMAASLVLAALTAAPPASATDPAPPPGGDAQEIPTQLDNPPIPEDLDGACSFCRVFPVTTTAADPQEASFELYFADDGHSVLADIEVLVLLMNDEYRTIVIHDVELLEQQFHEFVLDSGADWDWDDARHAWVSISSVP